MRCRRGSRVAQVAVTPCSCLAGSRWRLAGCLGTAAAALGIGCCCLQPLLPPLLPALKWWQRPNPCGQADGPCRCRHCAANTIAGSMAGGSSLLSCQHQGCTPHRRPGGPQAQLRRCCGSPHQCWHARQRPLLALICRLDCSSQQQRTQRRRQAAANRWRLLGGSSLRGRVREVQKRL